MRTSQRPTVKSENSPGGYKDNVYQHPAFGVIRVSNPQGQRVLFGSDTEHGDFIEIEIASAELKRGLNTDWIHGSTRPIVSIAMSHAQFVSMIQSSGKGSGTPCTLQYAPAEFNKTVQRVPNIEPIQSKTELIKDEIERDTRKALEMAQLAINKLKEQVDTLKAKKSISKGDVNGLDPLIKVAQTKLENLPSNLKFALDCAEETIDKAVHDAKIEIEASVEHKLRQIGLEAMNADPEIDLKALLSEKNIERLDN